MSDENDTVTMTRVELVARDDGFTIIVCDPAGDERATAKGMAGFLGFIIDRQEAKSIGIQVVSPIEPIQKPIDALIPHLNKLTLVGQFCSE